MRPSLTIERLARWKRDLPTYARQQLRILDKSNQIIPLRLNAVQRDFHAKLEAQRARIGRVRVVVLKARQLGLSTYLAARMFAHAHLRAAGARCYVLTHDDDTAKKLCKMPKLMYDHLTPELRRARAKANDHELELSHGALLEYHTAGQGTKGRGGTISHFHSSEVGFQDHAALHMAASLQQLGERPGTEAYFESTANGPSGPFYELWRGATNHSDDYSDFMPVFYPWHRDPEYATPVPPGFALSWDRPNDVVPSEHEYAEQHGCTLAQMHWRRRKMRDLGLMGMDGALVFSQEYPATPEEAFLGTTLDSFISPQHVHRAMARPVLPEMMQMPLVLGCDPSPAHGSASTALVWRRGTCAYRIERWRGLGAEQQAQRLYETFLAERAVRLCIDTSEGTGHAIYEMLRGRPGLSGHVHAVQFGGRPNDRSRFTSKRAEMWTAMHNWLARDVHLVDEHAVPGQPTLATELISVRRKEGNERQVKLESKDDMRRRNVASPDGADALAVTFALPDPDPGMVQGTWIASTEFRPAQHVRQGGLPYTPDDGYHVATMDTGLV